jgi:phosphatidylserine/phosphatidylglycerophosphate/cardiolipin synthase-like enzyme
MDWLLLATGFTGGLTVVFLCRVLIRWLSAPLAISVAFSPKGNAAEAVVREIKRSREEVLVQARAFSARAITDALVEAKSRGLQVEIVLDGGEEPKASARLMELLGDGITPLVDSEHVIHHQFMVIDGQTVLSGSFPFTDEAEAEEVADLVVIRGDAELARTYRQQFLDHKTHSEPAKPRAKDIVIPASPLPAGDKDKKAA